jgi:hypothetical protein
LEDKLGKEQKEYLGIRKPLVKVCEIVLRGSEQQIAISIVGMCGSLTEKKFYLFAVRMHGATRLEMMAQLIQTTRARGTQAIASRSSSLKTSTSVVSCYGILEPARKLPLNAPTHQ